MTRMVNTEQVFDRELACLVGRGYHGETFDSLATINTQLMVGGTVYFAGIGLIGGDLVTNVIVGVNVAGTAMTLSKVGLYDSVGNRLTLSADQGASWATVPPVKKVIPMITPFRVLTSGMYYLAMVAAATVLPTVRRGTAVLSEALPGFLIEYGSMAGQVDLPNPLTIGPGVVGGAMWLAWS